MKLKVNKSELVQKISVLQSVVARKNTMPILSGFLLCAKDNKLTITGTDLEIELKTSVFDVSIDVDGSIVIDAHKFCEVARSLPHDEITINHDAESNIATISSGRSRFKIQTMSCDGFPDMGFDSDAPKIAIKGCALHTLLSKTLFCAAIDEMKYQLNGVHIHKDENRIVAVGTDSHRLAMQKHEVSGIADFDPITIPYKTVSHILKIAKTNDADIDVFVSKNKIRVVSETDHFELVSKLIDAQFPDYLRVIPQDNNSALSVDKEEIKGALSRVAILSDQKSNSVNVNICKDKIEFSSKSNGDNAEEEISVTCDFEMNIGFNSKYFIDLLNNLDCKNITFLFGDVKKPILAKEDDAGLFLIMPVMV